MKSGNAAILQHATVGRALRLFDGARDKVRYMGEFQIDKVAPRYETDARQGLGLGGLR